MINSEKQKKAQSKQIKSVKENIEYFRIYGASYKQTSPINISYIFIEILKHLLQSLKKICKKCSNGP